MKYWLIVFVVLHLSIVSNCQNKNDVALNWIIQINGKVPHYNEFEHKELIVYVGGKQIDTSFDYIPGRIYLDSTTYANLLNADSFLIKISFQTPWGRHSLYNQSYRLRAPLPVRTIVNLNYVLITIDDNKKRRFLGIGNPYNSMRYTVGSTWGNFYSIGVFEEWN